MMRTLAWALVALAGCSSNTATKSPIVSASISVGVQRTTGAGAEPLLIGSTWRAGDQYFVDVTSEADAFLYVVLLQESGAQKVVAPREEGETIEVKKGQPLRVPLEGVAKVEGACAGTDRLFVVASQQPLTLADTVLYNAIDRMRRFEVRGKSCGSDAAAPTDDAYDDVATGEGTGGAGGAPGAKVEEGGAAGVEPPVPGLEPLPPPPPPPPKAPGSGVAADRALFEDRAACAGREECVGPRELKSKGGSYVAPFDDTGVVVVEIPFKHE